jgi:RHS repeat-associated protein
MKIRRSATPASPAALRERVRHRRPTATLMGLAVLLAGAPLAFAQVPPQAPPRTAPVPVATESLAVDVGAFARGRLTSMGNGATRRFYEYDTLGREAKTEHVLEGSSFVFVQSYGYPQNPGTTAGPGTVRRTLTYPDGEVVTYGYDAEGVRQTLTTARPGQQPQTLLSGVRRNGRGQVTQVTLGNGAVTTRSYNDGTDLRLNRIVTTLGAATIQDLRYSFDPVGNVTTLASTAAPVFSDAYGYDSLDQLTSMTSGAASALFQYDALGNLTFKGELGGGGRPQSYGGPGRGPHALASSAGVVFDYDANGNLRSTSGGLALTWNAENMAVRATQGSVERNRKSFVGTTLWKKVENGVTTHYLPGVLVENGQHRKFFDSFAERSPDGSLKFYHPDHLGSSTVVSDATQQVVRRAAYQPYGEDRGTPGGGFTPRFQFNFKERDATGLYDYGARLYDPATGRWVSADSSTADGPNRYAYVRNNPLGLSDPRGQTGTWAFRDVGRGYEWQYFSGKPPKGWTAHKVGEYGSVITLLSGAQVVLYRNGKSETVPSSSGSGSGGGGRDTATFAAAAVGGAVQSLTWSPHRMLLEWALGVNRPQYMEIPERAAAANPAGGITGAVAGSLVSGGIGIRLLRGSGPTTQLFGLRDGRPVYVIGRYPDPLARRLPGERVLNISNWTLEKNDLWIRNIIREGGHVNTVTPINPQTLWNAQRFERAIFAKELDQLLDAGYRLRLYGDTGTLVPPF